MAVMIQRFLSRKRIRKGWLVYLEAEGYISSIPIDTRSPIGLAMHDSIGGWKGIWETDIMVYGAELDMAVICNISDNDNTGKVYNPYNDTWSYL